MKHLKFGTTWKQRYKVASYLRSSLWIIPIGAVVLNLALTRAIHGLDAQVQ